MLVVGEAGKRMPCKRRHVRTSLLQALGDSHSQQRPGDIAQERQVDGAVRGPKMTTVTSTEDERERFVGEEDHAQSKAARTIDRYQRLPIDLSTPNAMPLTH
jgi:hypothetical protein